MSERIPGLSQNIRESFSAMDSAVEQHAPAPAVRRVGRIHSVEHGIAQAAGLYGTRSEELLRMPGELYGMAYNVDEKEVGIILLGESGSLGAGDSVYPTGQVVTTPVGDAVIGRVVDALGRPMDGKGPLRESDRLPVERPAPPIMDRAPVTQPLQSGLKVVDALLPIGRGQRELILGDRQTGKTTVAVDTIINQHGTDVLCIYCAVGKRTSAVARVIAELRDRGAMEFTTVMVATEDDPPGLQWIAPYAAASMGEFFMHNGRDVLVVFDDLTRHARAYRELSLLLRRPPGREAYPGDIFYIHSRLLERSTHLREEYGGGSLTALPIIETEAQNVSAYIPTNLISITDGQVLLSPDLFSKGILPAVDVGKSVSRVGGKTQLPAYRAVAGDLRLAYSQFEELESFARFGTRLDEETKSKLERGRRVREVLKQMQHDTLPVCEQIAALLAVNQGVFDALSLDSVAEAEKRVRDAVRERLPDVCDSISDGEKLGDEAMERILGTAQEAVAGMGG
ncbi:MAG: alternate F1F0 ATPase, F1 subunit alpha [Desulfatibacillaceae bacterium]